MYLLYIYIVYIFLTLFGSLSNMGYKLIKIFLRKQQNIKSTYERNKLNNAGNQI